MRIGNFVSMIRNWRVNIEQAGHEGDDDWTEYDSEQAEELYAAEHADEDHQAAHLGASADQPRPQHVLDERQDDNVYK